eukprot:3898112-Amphidinium_carterae.1
MHLPTAKGNAGNFLRRGDMTPVVVTRAGVKRVIEQRVHPPLQSCVVVPMYAAPLLANLSVCRPHYRTLSPVSKCCKYEFCPLSTNL